MLSRKIIEVVARDDAPDPDGASMGVGMTRRWRTTPDMEARGQSYRFEEVDAGIIVTGKRSVLVPWTNIRGVVLAEIEIGDSESEAPKKLRPRMPRAESAT